MFTNPPSKALVARASVSAQILFALLLPVSVLYAQAQAGPKESLQAIQTQVEAIQPRLIKSTVVLNSYDGSGSGVILSPDGLVLTAAHVIEGPSGRHLRAVLADGRSFPATVVAANRASDLGLVKLDGAADLPDAPLGDSAALRRGEWILATGHPLGRHPGRPPVLRIGRVLALIGSRGDREAHTLMTDAPIISGDSGGPLFDLNGRVVGINSMVTTGGRQQVSLHVPINLSKAAVAQARKGEVPDTWDGPPTAFARALHESQSALLSGDLAHGLQAATEAVALDPASAAARLALARAYARKGQASAAITSLEQACERGFNDADRLRKDPDFASLTRQVGFTRLLARLDAFNGIPGSRKGEKTLLDALASPNANRGVARIKAGGAEVALGTIMSADGDVLTKASELPDGPLTCVLPDGRAFTAERRGTDSSWDVALLKIQAANLSTLSLQEGDVVGQWTFSPDTSGVPQAVGVVGVEEMPVRDRGITAKPTSKAYMGVQLEPVRPDMLQAIGLKHGVKLIVQPDMPAARAGIHSGDIVYELEGKAVYDPDGLMDMLVNKKPGDSVLLRVAREDERLTVTIPLTSRPAGLMGRGGIPEMLSGDISRMQGPFPHVLQHDAVLPPNAMGGPLLDLEGRCLGINIARADRTSTYAIEARDLKEIYARLRAGK